MPYPRQTLSELRAQVAQDIVAQLTGSDPLLRHSNLKITGVVQAGLAHLHFGYLDWIARMAVPFTADDEYLEGWAALKGVVRLPPAGAIGVVNFPGTNGAVVPAGTPIVRGDGVEYVSTADATVLSGAALVPALAVADPDGKLGARGNCDVGTAMTLGQTISGVGSSGTASTAFTGGADLETNDALRTRMLETYAAQPELGTAADYVNWAKQVPGVSRAWAFGDPRNAPTVRVFIMLDAAQSAHGGFPQGTDGVATNEPRGGVKATGDQLAVADHLYDTPLEPLLALVVVQSPVAHPINFTIQGIFTATTATKAAVAAAIRDVFMRSGSPGSAKQSALTGSTVDLSEINSAIASVPSTAGFVITSPPGNVQLAFGELPTLGAMTYT